MSNKPSRKEGVAVQSAPMPPLMKGIFAVLIIAFLALILIVLFAHFPA